MDHDTLWEALLAAQKEIEHADYDKENPHFGSRYTSITGVLDTVKPTLNKHGIILMQSPGLREDGKITVETMLIHAKTGEKITGEAASPADKKGPQAVGSVISYLRRYSLTAMLGIGQKDDDGEGATDNKKKGKNHEAGVFGHTLDLEALLDKHAEAEWMTFEVRQRAAQAIDEANLDRMKGAIKWIEDQAKSNK